MAWGNNLGGWTANSILPAALPVSNFSTAKAPGVYTWGQQTPTGWAGTGPDISGLAATAGPSYNYNPLTPGNISGSNSADVVHNILSAIYGHDYAKILNFNPYKVNKTAVTKKSSGGGKSSSGIGKILGMGDPGGHFLGLF